MIRDGLEMPDDMWKLCPSRGVQSNLSRTLDYHRKPDVCEGNTLSHKVRASGKMVVQDPQMLQLVGGVMSVDL